MSFDQQDGRWGAEPTMPDSDADTTPMVATQRPAEIRRSWLANVVSNLLRHRSVRYAAVIGGLAATALVSYIAGSSHNSGGSSGYSEYGPGSHATTLVTPTSAPTKVPKPKVSPTATPASLPAPTATVQPAPTANPAPAPTATPTPKAHREIEEYGANEFGVYQNASNKGAYFNAGQTIVAMCLIYDPNTVVTSTRGLWYRFDDNGNIMYIAANTFVNNPDGSSNDLGYRYDPTVPICGDSPSHDLPPLK